MKNIFSKKGIDYSQLPPESLKFAKIKPYPETDEERRNRIIKEYKEGEGKLAFVFINDIDQFMNPLNVEDLTHTLNDIIHLDGTPIMKKIYSYSYGMLFYNFKTWFTYYGRSLYRTKFGWFVKSNKWSTIYRSTGLFDALKYMYKYRKYNN